jgi:DNA-binding transcriptional LysR family regulator
MRLYASADYLKARGEPRRPEELKEHDCLVMSSQSSAGVWSFQVQRKSVQVAVRARAIANSFIVLRQFAAAGLGIARLPEHIGEMPDNGKLRRVLDGYAPPAVPMHAVYPSARHLSPKVRALIELLQTRFASHAK